MTEASVLIFRQLADPTSSTCTYLLGDPASGDTVSIEGAIE